MNAIPEMLTEMVDILYQNQRIPLSNAILEKYPEQEWIRRDVLLNIIRSHVSELYFDHHLSKSRDKPYIAWDMAIRELHQIMTSRPELLDKNIVRCMRASA